MDFGNLLSRAWHIVWNNKFMLVLGFLAAIGGGNGSANSNYSFGQNDFNLGPNTADEVARFFGRYGPMILGLVCVLFFIAVLLWLLRLSAQGALISSAARIDAGEKVTFGEAFSAGTRHLGRLVGINILLYGPFTLLGLIAAGFVLSMAGTAVFSELAGASASEVEAIAGTLGILAACVACLFCLLAPLMILVTVVYPFAQRGAVLNDMGITASIGHGWAIVRANLGDIILLVLLFVVLGIVFGIVSVMVLLPFALLSMGPAILGAISRNAFQVLDVFMIVVGGIVVGLVAAAINSIMVAFRSTAVTLAYRQFLEKEAQQSV